MIRHHLHHLIQTLISHNLLVVLFISWSVGASLSSLKMVNVSHEIGLSPTSFYVIKCIIFSLIFLFFSVFSYRFFKREYKADTKYNLYLIAALMVCMLVSSWFNFVFCNPDNYYLLIDARYGDGLSWKNIYKSVEILCLIKVGIDGIVCLASRFSCRKWLRSDIISTIFNFLSTKT